MLRLKQCYVMTSITLDGLKKENYVIMLKEKKKLFFFRKIFFMSILKNTFNFLNMSTYQNVLPEASIQNLLP